MTEKTVHELEEEADAFLRTYFDKLELAPDEYLKHIQSLSPQDAYTQGMFASFKLTATFLKKTVPEDMERLRSYRTDNTDLKNFNKVLSEHMGDYVLNVVVPLIEDGTVFLWATAHIVGFSKHGKECAVPMVAVTKD